MAQMERERPRGDPGQPKAPVAWPWLGRQMAPFLRPAPRVISRPIEALSFALVFTAALVLRLATLGDDSLWIDEGYTLAAADLPLSTLWTVPFDTHPPLHFTIVKLFSWIAAPEWAVRLPSALFGLATLIPLHLLARRRLSNLGALVAITVWALSYTQLVYANNGRNYTELIFFLVVALHALVILAERLASGDRLRASGMAVGGGLYAVGALGALYTHNTAILYLFAINATLCAWQLVNAPRSALAFMLRLFAFNALPILLWLPWLTVMLTATSGFNWLEQKSVLQALFTLAVTIGPNDVPAPAALVFFATLAGGWASVVWRTGLTNLLIAFHLAIYPALIWLVGLVYVPIYMERIILIATLGAALAMGALAARVRPLAAGPGLAALALAASLASAMAYPLRGEAQDNLGAHLVQDWRQAIAESETSRRDGPVAFTICDTFSWPVAATYAGEGRVHVHRPGQYWDMTRDDWTSLYGQSVRDRLETPLGEVSGPTLSPADLHERYSRIVFLQADIYCQGTEAEQIHSELTGAGFRKAGSRDYRGLTAHDFLR